MLVTKRDGTTEPVKFDKITARISKLCFGLDKNFVDPTVIAAKTVEGVYDKVSTEEIDSLAAEISASLTVKHPDYGLLAGRIAVSNLHKKTKASFAEVMYDLYHYINPKTGKQAGLISDEVYDISQKHAEEIETFIKYNRDMTIDYFAFKTLQKSYLLKINGKIAERPSHMYMRVALGIHGTDLERAFETYHLMSKKAFTHATPTLFNAGTPHPQMSSCFLLGLKEDSMEGIFNTVKDTAIISKHAGGIGLHISNLRASGSYIAGTNGISNGLVPFLKVFNETARYSDQCLSGASLVATKKGFAEIQSIVPGDEVLTHDGTFQKVLRVLHKQHKGKLIQIDTGSCSPILVTDTHELFTDRGWLKANEINTDTKLVSPLFDFIQDLGDFSPDDCKFYGVLYASGSISSDMSQASVFRHKEFVKEYLARIGIESFETEGMLKWVPNRYQKITYGMLYDTSTGTSKFSPLFLHLPYEKTLALLSGIFKPDFEDNQFIYSTVEYLLNRIGCYPTQRFIDPISLGKIFPIEFYQYLVTHPHQSINNNISKKIAYHKIKSLEYVDYEGPVFDLEVENNHNYTTSVGLVHNGGGRRKGSFAMYIEPWHDDIFEFLEMRKNHGKEEMRARDLFYALWMPDLFMKKVEAEEDWALFCPNEAPGLADVYGDEFEALYNKYVSENKHRRTVKARDLWLRIIDSQIETGTPYIMYKDAANKKSNQKNLGTIKSSNLCTEIIEYSDDKEQAVCNLASISLPYFVKGSNFDFNLLKDVSRHITRNLNLIIDKNFYPTPETRVSNMKHRPIGIGVQGLADVFAMLGMPFDSEEAKSLNKEIFAAIYYGAVEESIQIAKETQPYSSFEGSPASQGLLQYDLWGEKPSFNWDWDSLKKDLAKYGMANSLLLAPMPTASTSQILGNNECFEPYTSNIYTRRVLSGEFVVVNKHLVRDLIKEGLWNESIRQKLISENGSVQNIPEIPVHIKEVYKTVWELKQRDLIDMSADRGIYICQSQSLNLFVADPNIAKLTSMHFYAWKKGLKTGMYYLRTKAAADAIKFTVELPTVTQYSAEEALVCSLDNPEACEACSG